MSGDMFRGFSDLINGLLILAFIGCIAIGVATLFAGWWIWNHVQVVIR